MDTLGTVDGGDNAENLFKPRSLDIVRAANKRDGLDTLGTVDAGDTVDATDTASTLGSADTQDTSDTRDTLGIVDPRGSLKVVHLATTAGALTQRRHCRPCRH